MLRIGEFSSLGQVTVKALRLYDDMGLLKPAYVDRSTNYRYYVLDQLPRLNRILAFKDLGFSLEQIAGLLAEDVPAAQIRGMLLLKEAEIQRRVLEEQTLLTRVEARLRVIEQEDTALAYDVVVKSIEAQTVVSTRRIMPTVIDMGDFSRTVDALLREHGMQISGPLFHMYHHKGYRETDLDVEIGFPVDAVVRGPPALDGGLRFTARELAFVPTMAALIVTEGNSVPEAYSTIGRWIYSNGFSITGPCRELYHGKRGAGPDQASHVIEIQYPVTKAREERVVVDTEGAER